MPDIDLGLVKGSKGDKGDKGDTGNPGERGIQGVPGEAGKSAYQAARDGGYTGTEAEFNAIMAIIEKHAGRHKTGGADPLTAADVGAAPAGYGEGTKQDGVKGVYPGVGGAVGWYRICTSNQITAAGIISISNQWASSGASDVVLMASPMGGLSCVHYRGSTAAGDLNVPVVSDARLVLAGSGLYALDVYYRISGKNSWTVNVVNTGATKFDLQTPTFVAEADTLPDGETLVYPMEFVNPPMKLGKEYRTTERYMGKPVYTMLFNFGSGPSGESKVVEHGIENALPFSCEGAIFHGGSSMTMPWGANSSLRVVANQDKVTCWLEDTTQDWSAYTVRVLLKYIKTTD